MIISVVEALVAQLDVDGVKFGFNHGPSHWQNLELDEYNFGYYDFSGEKAIAYLDQPITNDYQLTAGGYIGEFYPVDILFMYKSEFDWTPQQHEANCIDPANNAIRQFISICQSRTDLVFEILNPTALEFTNLRNVNVSGKSLSIRIKPVINKAVCVPPIPTP